MHVYGISCNHYIIKYVNFVSTESLIKLTAAEVIAKWIIPCGALLVAFTSLKRYFKPSLFTHSTELISTAL